MPERTPPWERMPLYITSFQSSPVRICRKARHHPCHPLVTWTSPSIYPTNTQKPRTETPCGASLSSTAVALDVGHC